MIIKDANIFTQDNRFVKGSVVVENGRFVSIAEQPEHAGEVMEVIEAKDLYMIPGLVDIQNHGCMGADMCDGTKEALDVITQYEASVGVTSVCPATMTIPKDELSAVMKNAGAYAYHGGAHLVGINMEGPFISPGKVGAQNPSYVRGATMGEFERWQEAAQGKIKLVDVAPEEPGNLEFIREVSGRVRVSLAHMCADYETAAAAFEAGARHMTHLFNAMPGLHHREPGPIAAAADRRDVTCEIIADGVHIAPSMVRLAFSLFPERMILISDSLRACGLGDGTFELGGQLFTVHGNRATIENGSLAGSVSSVMACLRTAVTKMGIPLEIAVRAATMTPAKALGIEDERGSIASGKIADAVVLDGDLQVKHVVLRGMLLF